MEARPFTEEQLRRAVVETPDLVRQMFEKAQADDAWKTRMEHAVLGVPLDPAGSVREGGLIHRLANLESFTRGVFFTVLSANVFGAAVVAALIYLMK